MRKLKMSFVPNTSQLLPGLPALESESVFNTTYAIGFDSMGGSPWPYWGAAFDANGTLMYDHHAATLAEIETWLNGLSLDVEKNEDWEEFKIFTKV